MQKWLPMQPHDVMLVLMVLLTKCFEQAKQFTAATEVV
jgi:hypothetical protein